MKKILYLAIVALMTLNLADLKAGEDPHGLYHLKRFIYLPFNNTSMPPTRSDCS